MSDLPPLTGEPLALDLVNTQPSTGDLLATPQDLAAWVESQADRFPDPDGRFTDADLAAVKAVRDHAARALGRVRRGDRPARGDLDALNRAQRVAPAISAAQWGGAGVVVTRRREGSPGERLAALLAEAVVELLADPDVGKVRQCEADDCVLLFLPAHPRRRWCSAARCGNRVRVQRHYQRHRSE